MQKQIKNKYPGSISRQLVSFTGILLLSLALSSFNVIKISTVTFTATDGLEVTADAYIIAEENPYILLFHEQGSSRGEFQNIAQRFCKMDYNCLAVDIRNGGNSNHVSNETAKRCRGKKCALGAGDVELDILAAIEFAYAKSNKPVVLMGSGANGSLCLKVAYEHENVKAVIALSPGEYFLPGLNIQDTISHLNKPVFISSSLSELPFVSQLISEVDDQYISLFEPQLGEGGRGTASLTTANKHNSEYWFALLLFFKDLM